MPICYILNKNSSFPILESVARYTDATVSAAIETLSNGVDVVVACDMGNIQGVCRHISQMGYALVLDYCLMP